MRPGKIFALLYDSTKDNTFFAHPRDVWLRNHIIKYKRWIGYTLAVKAYSKPQQGKNFLPYTTNGRLIAPAFFFMEIKVPVFV